MKVGIVQFSPIWEDKSKNMDKINYLVSNLETETSILIFPEMTLTGFTMNSKKIAEELDGESIKYFLKLSLDKKVDIIAGLVEKDKGEYYNSLYHFTSEGLIKAVYKKIHPFSLANEDKNFSAGNEVVISKFDNKSLGLSICYDLRFPELYRLYGKEKVEIMINIANWPVKRINHWKYLLRARAIENQCFMIGVNRVGNDPYQTYNGCSAIYSPMGEELILCGNDEKIYFTKLDLEEINNTREKLGFLDDIKLI